MAAALSAHVQLMVYLLLCHDPQMMPLHSNNSSDSHLFSTYPPHTNTQATYPSVPPFLLTSLSHTLSPSLSLTFSPSYPPSPHTPNLSIPSTP